MTNLQPALEAAADEDLNKINQALDDIPLSEYKTVEVLAMLCILKPVHQRALAARSVGRTSPLAIVRADPGTPSE